MSAEEDKGGIRVRDDPALTSSVPRQEVSGRFLARLSRRTTTGLFIPEIDGLRFVAIGMVVVAHVANLTNSLVAGVQPAHSLVIAPAPVNRLAGSWLLQTLQAGGFGVQLFFVISGFVLGLPFAAHWLAGDKPVRLGPYFLRRLTRLEPPYIVSLTLILILALVLGLGSFGSLLPHYLVGLTYMHNVVYGEGNRLNVIAWSLEIEIQFYLLVPLLTAMFRVRRTAVRRGALVLACVVAIAAQQFLFPAGSFLSVTIANYIQYFLMGFLLVDIYLVDWKRAPVRRAVWDLVWFGTAVAMVATLVVGARSAWLFPLAAFGFFVASFRGRLSGRILRNRWIFTIGGMCYSIYLLHYPLILLFAAWSRNLRLGSGFFANFLIQMVILVPAVLAFSALFFVLVERPCMNRRWPVELAACVRSWGGR